MAVVLERYLTSIEAQFKGITAIPTVSYEGRIDEGILARALERLCRRHPVLSARIETDQHGQLLRAQPSLGTKLVVLDGDEGTLGELANTPLNPSTAVAQVVLVRNSVGGLLGFRLDHSIVDASSAMSMFRELMEIYQSILNGVDPPPNPHLGIPVSPVDLLKERWLSDDSTTEVEKPSFRAEPVVTCRAINRSISLGVRETEQLVDAARKHETTVHALVCGVILSSLRDQFCEFSKRAEPMVCWSVVDLRRHVKPPVEATETTVFLGYHKADLSIPINADIGAVACDIRSQLDIALAGRKVSLNPADVLTYDMHRSRTPYCTSIFVTNGGIIPSVPSPPGLQIREFVLPHPNEMVARRPIPYRVLTYNSELKIMYSFPSSFFADNEVDQFSRRAYERILSL